MEHVTVYRNPAGYSAFPDILKLRNGDIVVTFREAGLLSVTLAAQKQPTHIDPSANGVLVRSRDGGRTFDPFTKVAIYDDEELSTQDHSITELSDGTLLVVLYRWRHVPLLKVDSVARQGLPIVNYASKGLGFWVHEGPFVARSRDGGYAWERDPAWADPSPLVSAHVADKILELPDGTLLMAVCGDTGPFGTKPGSPCYVLGSKDRGGTWRSISLVGSPDRPEDVSYYEPALLSLGNGRLTVMIRAVAPCNFYQSFSEDWGRTWSSPVRTPIVASNVPHLLALKNGHVLCAYGRRDPKYGIRACISRDGGTTWDTKNEIVLRDDGAGTDCGYPSSIQFDDGTILTVYYIHHGDDIRYIAGTFWREEEFAAR